MINLIYRGLKRWLFGPTTIFAVRRGSAAFLGSSFVQVYQERAAYPLRIVGIQFVADVSSQGEWLMSIDGKKCFPFSDVNPMDSHFHNLIPIEVAAGSLLQIEIRSRNKEYKGIVILEELDVVELR